MSRWTLGATLAALALAGACSSSDSDGLAPGCPNAYRVQEASGLVKFKPGPGRDPSDVLYRAEIGTIEVSCSFNTRRQYVDVELKVQLLVAQGPSTGTNRANFEYAVGVLAPGGVTSQRQRFAADVGFVANRSRGTVTDEVVVRLPYTSEIDPAAYRIAIGLVLTPEELDYNLRAIGLAPRTR